jgi:aarF domain-containing kinase
VKVRHPNVEQQIGIDFIIMKAVASLVDITPGLSWLKLSETMSQFSATIASQTDLSTEGRHLYLFNHFFKRWRGVSFPSPIILTNSILVETFEFGDSVDKYARNLRCKVEDSILENLGEFKGTDSKINKAEKFAKILKDCDLAHFIVTTGEDTYLKMLLQDNLMHADLHPGNILIQDEKKTRIVLVDAGMVARLLPKEQKNFIGLLEAMGEGRGDEAADHIMQFTSKPEYNLDTKKSFRKDMKEMFSISCKGYGKNVDIGVALREILNLVRVHKITIDANYATLIMNALCLDGMAMSLLPSYNILDGAKPLLRFNRLFKRIPGNNK